MISVSELNTSVLNFAKMVNNELVFGDIDLYNLFFHVKTYKGESDTNLDIFVDKFDTQNPRKYVSKFLLSSSRLNINSSVFRLTDENKDSPVVLNFTDLNILATDFLISGPDIDANIKRLSFIDSRGLALKNIETVFSYTPTKMLFSDLGIRTDSSLVSGQLQFDYQREDLNSFSDKVIISGFFENSSLDLGEFNLLYDEFGDNQINSNNTFQGGGTKFKTTTDLEELSATLGLGYSFGNDVTSLNINYEANANDDEYVSHYGSVKIVAKF